MNEFQIMYKNNSNLIHFLVTFGKFYYIQGLETARSRIDDFLNLFPDEIIATSKAKIREENELNAKEFDPEIGAILNPNPTPKQS